MFISIFKCKEKLFIYFFPFYYCYYLFFLLNLVALLKVYLWEIRKKTEHCVDYNLLFVNGGADNILDASV